MSVKSKPIFQRASEDEVETASTVDEYSGELDLCHHGVQDQGEFAGLRKKLVH
jgi:hypothetical protein